MNDLSVLLEAYIKKSQNNFMIEINVKCPNCRSESLCYDRYDAPWKILKPASWLYCKHCNYQMDFEKYKKSLFCA